MKKTNKKKGKEMRRGTGSRIKNNQTCEHTEKEKRLFYRKKKTIFKMPCQTNQTGGDVNG
jgi:hypothetical protein